MGGNGDQVCTTIRPIGADGVRTIKWQTYLGIFIVPFTKVQVFFNSAMSSSQRHPIPYMGAVSHGAYSIRISIFIMGRPSRRYGFMTCSYFMNSNFQSIESIRAAWQFKTVIRNICCNDLQLTPLRYVALFPAQLPLPALAVKNTWDEVPLKGKHAAQGHTVIPSPAIHSFLTATDQGLCRNRYEALCHRGKTKPSICIILI